MRIYKIRKIAAACIAVVILGSLGCGQKQVVSDDTEVTENKQQNAEKSMETVSTETESNADSENFNGLYQEQSPYEDTDFSFDAMYLSPQPGETYGETMTIDYYSSTVGMSRKANVFLPAEYNESRRYPVLYLLHGLGADQEGWGDMGAKYIVQNLHIYDEVPEMIVVCTDSLVVSGDRNRDMEIGEIVAGYDQSIDDIVNDLMPFVNRNFSVKQGRENTAIAGYSMGGRESLYIGFSHPELFGYIGAFSPASGVIAESAWGALPALMEDFTINAQYGQFPMLLLNIGINDEICKTATELYDAVLTQKSIQHIFYETEGGHDGGVWQHGLYHFAKRLFY